MAAHNLANAVQGHATNNLKRYWLAGEGRAKWNTFTELYHHLIKFMTPDMAKRTAAQWFHERFGFWPGADVNRVKNGKPPRGKRVGPGDQPASPSAWRRARAPGLAPAHRPMTAAR